MDGSKIYGSDDKSSSDLRTMVDGLLKSENISSSTRQRKFKKRNPESTEELTVALQDEVLRIQSVHASAKAKAIDVHVSTKGELRLLVLLRGNSFEIHVVDTKVSIKNDVTKVGALSIPGHRTDVRALCFSSEKIALASASGESLKIWNRGSQNCIRTMACDYALAILFATGDRNLIVATKTGKLQIFDIAAGRLLEEIAAHEGEAWTVTMSPDLRGIASDGRTRAGNFGNLNWWWTGQWRRKKTTTTTSR